MKIKRELLNKYFLDIVILALILIFSIFIIFNNLGLSDVHEWDESRHAVNAMEMIDSGDWIVMKYAGVPDYYNLKPPLANWFIGISFLIFGVSEFSLRFFSAFFGVATIILVYFFGKSLRNRYVGVIASLLLLTNKYFIGVHGARTGDCDSILVFFITCSLFVFYKFHNSDFKKVEYLYLFSVFVSFAVLTKSVIGFIPILVCFCFLIITKNFKNILIKETIYSIVLFFIITAPWFILRLIREKGFLYKMIMVDVINRGIDPIQSEPRYFNYYFQFFLKTMIPLFVTLFIIGIIYYLIRKEKINNEIKFLLSWIIVVFLLFSFSKGKLIWYLNPIYPAVSLFLSYFFVDLKKYFKIKDILFIAIVILFFIFPIINIIHHNETRINELEIKILKDNQNIFNDIDKLYIYSGDRGHNGDSRQRLFFYLSLYTPGDVFKINDLTSNEINSGDYLITFDLNRGRYLNNLTEYELIKKEYNLGLFRRV